MKPEVAPPGVVPPESASLIATGISKQFGSLMANHDVNLSLYPGEVHVIMGENGAGKSTIINIAAGRIAQDAGAIVVKGKELPRGKPLAAMRAKVGVVYQELMLVPTMTGFENLLLSLRAQPWASNTRSLRDRIAWAAERYDIHVDMDVPVRRLGLPQQQRIELLRALCQEPDFLLLDEPTGLLPPIVVSSFLQNVRGLARQGLAVALVSHRIAEMRAVADRVTIMRRGRVVGHFEKRCLPDDAEVSRLIVGSIVEDVPEAASCGADPVLEVVGLGAEADRAAATVEGASLVVHRGEIVGLAGVDGNGQEELLKAIAGLRPIQAGSISLAGVPLERAGYRDRLKAGLVYVTGDRKNEGIIPGLSAAENVAVGCSDRNLDPNELITRLGVQPPAPLLRADAFSGGNQQKLMLARALARHPKMLLLSYPLRGLDIQAAQAVRMLLIEQAEHGVGVLIAWSDLEELLTICHKVIIMDRGHIVGEQLRGAFDASLIGEWLTGSSSGDLVGSGQA